MRVAHHVGDGHDQHRPPTPLSRASIIEYAGESLSAAQGTSLAAPPVSSIFIGMTDFQSDSPPSASATVELGSSHDHVPYRSISRRLGGETRIYLAEDNEGITRWWREVSDESVGYDGPPEQVSFEEVLDAFEPRYWPVLCAWMLEDLIQSEGWHSYDERWRELLQSKPDAQQQLKEILVAIMPPSDPDELRVERRLSREAAEANVPRAVQRALQIGEYEQEPDIEEGGTSPLDAL